MWVLEAYYTDNDQLAWDLDIEASKEEIKGIIKMTFDGDGLYPLSMEQAGLIVNRFAKSRSLEFFNQAHRIETFIILRIPLGH